MGNGRFKEYIKIYKELDAADGGLISSNCWVNEMKRAKSQAPYKEPENMVMRHKAFGCSKEVEASCSKEVEASDKISDGRKRKKRKTKSSQDL